MRLRFLGHLLLVPVLAQGQMYRWVDDKGTVHYSDQAPVPGARDVQKRSISAAQGSSPQLPYALQQAVRDFPVTLYTAVQCKEGCAQAGELLNKRGVPYREVTVANEADVAKLKKLSGSDRLPVMTVGSEVQIGFESGAYNAALDRALYPSTSLLPPGVQTRQPVTQAVKKATPAAAEVERSPPAAPQETANTTATH